MTANSVSSVAESDGELSAVVRSDLTVDEDAVDGLVAADDVAVESGENLDDANFHAEYRRLAAGQGALRRVAALVARGVGPLAVFGAAAEEMRRCALADTAGLWHFETDGEITIVAAAARPGALTRWPVGTRTPVGSQHHRGGGATRRPARADRQLRQLCRVPRRSRARGGRDRGGGGANHR
jgi:hypothetical protein